MHADIFFNSTQGGHGGGLSGSAANAAAGTQTFDSGLGGASGSIANAGMKHKYYL